jgi:hypothetical protein
MEALIYADDSADIEDDSSGLGDDSHPVIDTDLRRRHYAKLVLKPTDFL